MTPEEKITQLEMQIQRLNQKVEQLDKQTIKIVGDVDTGDDVPVTVNGRRRKILTSAP